MLRTSFIQRIAVSASVLSSLGLLLSMPQPAQAQRVQMEEEIPATVEENSPVMTGGSPQPAVTQPSTTQTTPNASTTTTNSPRALW